jgi:hypothetical protein
LRPLKIKEKIKKNNYLVIKKIKNPEINIDFRD